MEFQSIVINNSTNQKSHEIIENDCKNLSSIQILKQQKNCIFSEIAKNVIIKNGLFDVYILLQYCKDSDYISDIDFKLNKNGEKVYEYCKCIITLSNEGNIILYDNKNILYSNCVQNECIILEKRINFFINSKNYIILYFNNSKSYNIPEFINNNIYEKKIELTPLEANKFIINRDYYQVYDIDNESFIKYINNKYDISNKDLKYIFFIEFKERENDITIYNNDNIGYDLYNNNKIFNIHGLNDIYNLTIKQIDFKNSLLHSNSLKISLKEFNDSVIKVFNENIDTKILFFNEIDSFKIENFFTNICKDILLNEMGIKYIPSQHDISVISSDFKEKNENKLLYKIYFTINETNNDELLILEDYNNNENEIDLIKNHIYIINPEPFTIVGSKNINIFSNSVKDNNIITINIYNKISREDFWKTTFSRKKYLNFTSDITMEFDYNKISLIDAYKKHITLYDIDKFNTNEMINLSKNLLNENKILHFFLDMNISFINNVIESDNIYKLIKCKCSEKYCNILQKIYDFNKTITTNTQEINNSHELFHLMVLFYKEFIIDNINTYYNINSNYNVKKCFITSPNNTLIYNDIYSEMYDNFNKNTIIYISFNIDTNDNNFGYIKYYTNYINETIKNFENKNTIEFIIESEN